MKTKKILWTILGLIGGVVLLPYIIVILFYIIHGFAILISPAPIPSVTYAEFPFEITYEINGEVKTVNDIFVCKYDGVGMNEGVGKYIKWKGYVKSTGEEGALIFEDEEYTIYCSLGNPDYYMDDKDYIGAPPRPYIYGEEKFKFDLSFLMDYYFGDISLGSSDIKEKYNISLISWEIAGPIENSFK